MTGSGRSRGEGRLAQRATASYFGEIVVCFNDSHGGDGEYRWRGLPRN
jgi:hypothetical protein